MASLINSVCYLSLYNDFKMPHLGCMYRLASAVAKTEFIYSRSNFCYVKKMFYIKWNFMLFKDECKKISRSPTI